MRVGRDTHAVHTGLMAGVGVAEDPVVELELLVGVREIEAWFRRGPGRHTHMLVIVYDLAHSGGIQVLACGRDYGSFLKTALMAPREIEPFNATQLKFLARLPALRERSYADGH